MKRFLLVFFLLFSLLTIVAAFWFLSRETVLIKSHAITSPAAVQRLSLQAKEAKSYATERGFNAEIAMLIDMDLESGQNRLFVYNTLKDSVIDKGLVTHGRCNEDWLLGRKYDNTVGSGCTSLGRYKIGHAYKGKFGLAYKLIGLDSTNNNAFRRYVVLHSHECVPEREVDPIPICQSDGCPTVSKQFLIRLAVVIDKSSKPVLLWIYD